MSSFWAPVAKPTVRPPAASPRGEILGVVSTPGESVPQRIGDAERDRAVELLREHMAQGRLDEAEFDERLTAALSAKTSGDLDPLFTDLPGPRPGQGLASTAGYQAPPWSAGTAMTPTPATPTPHPRSWNRALGALSALIWPLTILLITFGLDWAHFWWLVFVPIMISSALGKDHQNRDRERERLEREQRRLDKRRRTLDD